MLVESLEGRRLMSADTGAVIAAEFNPQPDPPGHQALLVASRLPNEKFKLRSVDTHAAFGQMHAANVTPIIDGG
jgi:hypothetical protein